MPISRQLWQLACFRWCDGPFGADREMNPSAAARALAREHGVRPPSPDQRVVYGPPVSLDAEVDRLHRLVTAGVRTGGFRVNDMGCHVPLLASLPVEGMHPVQFLGGANGLLGCYLG